MLRERPSGLHLTHPTLPQEPQHVYVHLDSHCASSVDLTKEQYTFQLPKNMKNVARVEVVSAEIPLSFLTFGPTNRTLQFRTGTTIAVLQIPLDTSTTLTAVVAALETAKAGTPIADVLVFSIDGETDHFRVDYAEGADESSGWYIDLSYVDNIDLPRTLGFETANLTGIAVPAMADEPPVFRSSLRSVFVHLHCAGTSPDSLIFFRNSEAIPSSSVLARIQIDPSKLSDPYIVASPENGTLFSIPRRFAEKTASLTNISIHLSDQRGKTLSLPYNDNYSILLRLTIV